jgi:hypothetical protein
VLDETDSRPSMIDNTYVSMPSCGVQNQPTGVRRKGGGICASTTTLIIAFSLIVIAGIAALIFLRKPRKERLRIQFGSEYAPAVQESAGRRLAGAGSKGHEKRDERSAIAPARA